MPPRFPRRGLPPPTPDDLRSQIEATGLSQDAYARVVGVDRRSVVRWLAGDAAIPRAPYALVELLTALRLVAADHPEAVAYVHRAADVPPLPSVSD